MNKALSLILDFLYPKRCVLCDRPLPNYERYVCRSCTGKLKFIKSRTCPLCGRVLKSLYEELCAECSTGTFSFDGAFAPFAYTGDIKEALIRLKYSNRPEYAGFFAEAIWDYGKERIISWKPQMIIPVPVHQARLRKRGYNQAGLIAARLGKISGIAVNHDLIIRKKKTKAQKELGKDARRKNMAEAFDIDKGQRLPKRILIADDIFTTGSTADAISVLLKQNGAKKVYVVAAAN